MINVGPIRQQDTYLSPLNYNGTQLSLLHESLRPAAVGRAQGIGQHLLQATASTTTNAADNASLLGLMLRYDYSFFFTLRPLPHLRLWLGPQAGINLGCLYSTRNGNNPAQAIADVHIDASLAAIYDFHIRRHSFALRAQADWQLTSLLFSPDYGQSYYELFGLGHTAHNICWRSPFSVPTARGLITFDWHLRHTTLRLGAMTDLRQSHVNHLRHHQVTIGPLIGIVHHLHRVSPARQLPTGFPL